MEKVCGASDIEANKICAMGKKRLATPDLTIYELYLTSSLSHDYTFSQFTILFIITNLQFVA